MASIMTRKTKDGTEMYTARVRIKGYPQQTATCSRKTGTKLWEAKTKASIREGKYFSQAEAKKHTSADLAESYIKTVLGNKSQKAQVQYAQ